jgi:hypothetical protein
MKLLVKVEAGVREKPFMHDFLRVLCSDIQRQTCGRSAQHAGPSEAVSA